MTAVVHTPAVIDNTEAVDLLKVHSLAAGIEDFLQDPIGYGEYNFDDPISLDQFATTRHMRSSYAAPLV